MTRQELNRSEIRRAAADQGRFGAAQRVGATRLRIVSDEPDSPYDDTALLADRAIYAGTDRRPRTAYTGPSRRRWVGLAVTRAPTKLAAMGTRD